MRPCSCARRRHNVIGLLMMVVGTATTLPWFELQAFLPANSATTGALVVTAALLGTFAYVLTVFPVLFLLLLFPTGRPPGPRWRPLILYGLLLVLTIVAIVALTPILTVGDAVVRNPLSPLKGASAARMQAFADGSDTPFFALLFLFALGCAAAPFVRYRRAGVLERAQIRWLLYAGALFLGAFVTITMVGFERAGYLVRGLWDLGLLAIPVAVAIAILRHRLFDIDVIIRRTLQYGLLTGLYFGSVLVLRTLLGPLAAGADSPPVVMVTTLALAALFKPLRVRVQRFIDGRFYRRRVDGERAVARFAALARDEVDLDELRAALFGTVGGDVAAGADGPVVAAAAGRAGARR